MNNHIAEESRLPVALPIASTTPRHPRRPSQVPGPVTAGKTHPSLVSSQASARSRRLSASQLAHLVEQLSIRDVAIVRLVADHRFLTTSQIQSFVFTGHATATSAARSCRRVVERLRGLGLLAVLDRRVGGVRAGSASFIWHLTSGGSRLLAHMDGQDAPRRFHEPSQRLLDHCLMVADIHLQVRATTADGETELLSVELEPATWRTWTGLGGERHLLRPDMTAVTASGEYEDHWMLEADTGSEHPPTVVRACRRYLTYFATGIEQATHGVLPRVVWVVPHQRRADKLIAAFTAARFEPGAFRVSTLDNLRAVIAGGAG
jgi:hypothetical protein